MKDIANFLFEMGHMAETSRTGYSFLGSGKQSLAEHVNGVCYIGYALAMIDGTVDVNKVVQMCLFHDIAEARSLDHGYVAQKYVEVNEEQILKDQLDHLPFGKDIKDLLHEYFERKTPESLIAKDADNLELILTLKKLLDLGNTHAQDRLNRALERLKTDVGKETGKQIMETSYDDRWFSDKQSSRRVNRNKE